MRSDIPKDLYHYCSKDTFLKIVSNNTLRLSDISKTNDSKELVWFQNICNDIIHWTWEGYLKDLAKEGRQSEADNSAFQSLASDSDLFRKNELNKCWAIFLSEKADDLGQWRGYAEDGAGISIGFKSGFFKRFEHVDLSSIDEHLNWMLFDKVAYSMDEAHEYIIKKCRMYQISSSSTNEEVLEKIRDVIVNSMVYAPLFKNDYFKDEKEWRLAIVQSFPDLFEGSSPCDITNIPEGTSLKYDFMTRGDDLVSFVDLKYDRLSKYVSEIWLGPKCKWSEDDVLLLLISKGWIKSMDDDSIHIIKSEASYR